MPCPAAQVCGARPAVSGRWWGLQGHVAPGWVSSLPAGGTREVSRQEEKSHHHLVRELSPLYVTNCVSATCWDEAVCWAAVTCGDGRKVVSQSSCDKGLFWALVQPKTPFRYTCCLGHSSLRMTVPAFPEAAGLKQLASSLLTFCPVPEAVFQPS